MNIPLVLGEIAKVNYALSMFSIEIGKENPDEYKVALLKSQMDAAYRKLSGALSGEQQEIETIIQLGK